MLELDAETFEMLGYGEPWPSIVSIAYDTRARALEVKRAYMFERKPRKRSPLAPCPACGRTFDHRGSGKGWLRTFCSDSCRVKFHNRKAPAERPSACQACGEKLEQAPKRADGRGNRVRRYCNERCAKRAKRKKTPERI